MPETATAYAPASPSDPVYLQRGHDGETHRLLTTITPENVAQIRELLTTCQRRTCLEFSAEGNRR